MIFIAAYPDHLERLNSDEFDLKQLNNFLCNLAPKQIGLHLLPPYPSTGDGGFAPESWFEIRSELGSWVDIEKICQIRRVIIDGVYNHVGLNHHFIKSFFLNPTKFKDLIYAFEYKSKPSTPRSPRGFPALRSYEISGEVWSLWQTFSEHSVDIRLDSSLVINEIKEHLAFLKEKGFWGVRLDALAYYGKTVGHEQRYHPSSYKYAKEVINVALENQLNVVGQVDCNELGSNYYSKNYGSNSNRPG